MTYDKPQAGRAFAGRLRPPKGMGSLSEHLVLVINPGSTSTKVAVYRGDEPEFVETLRHSAEELSAFKSTMDQYAFRKAAIEKALESRGIQASSLTAIVARGGPLPPMAGGVYEVNDLMCEDLRAYDQGHASSLGGLIARELSRDLGIPAYIVDPVTVDELDEIARFSGVPEIPRRSLFHALNQKAVAARVARSMGKKYSEVNLIVAHLGGGITVGAHRKGLVVDVNDGLGGEGPYTPERAGGVPVCELVKLCFSGKYTKDEIMAKLVGRGGLVAYLGTNSIVDVEKMVESGDEKARLVFEGMAYQVAKEIGGLACALAGDVDRIVLTGGAANSKALCGLIEERVKFIAPVVVVPGENEMQALAEGALRVLRGEEKAKIYSRK